MWDCRGITLLVLLMTVGEGQGILPQAHPTVPISFPTRFQEGKVNSTCWAHVLHTIAAAQDHEEWALRMLDASTKIPDGLLYGNIDQLGNWEECLDVCSNDASAIFQGHYCRAVLNAVDAESGSQLLLMRIAVCAPSSCSPDDIWQLVELGAPLSLGPILGSAINVTSYVHPDYCSMQGFHPSPINVYGWIFAGLLGLLLLIVVAATVLDVLKKSTPTMEVLVSTFSAHKNLSELFAKGNEPSSLASLHGLRVLSMAWIIMGHRYETFLAMTPISNTFTVVDQIIRPPLSMTVVNAFLGVDTFFFLSGLLVCHVFFRQMKRGNKFDIIEFYLYRILSLPMALLIIFYLTFLSYLGDGPVWEAFIGVRFRKNCEQNWWSALLYVNNYIEIDKQCLEQTWYTSVDMQLTLLSPLISLPLYYSHRAGLELMALLTAISCFIPFTITYLNNYPWSVDLVNDVDTVGFNRDIYLPTHSRATPYLIGILVAFYLNHTHNNPWTLSKSWVATGWALCTCTCLAVVFCLSIPFQHGYQSDPVSAAFYAGFHRLGWSLGLGWIVVACAKGKGGPVNAILGWSGFIPLSQLTYAAYLTHLIVLGASAGARKTTSFMSHYEAVYAFLGDIPLVLCTSLILYTFVEAPLLVTLRRLFNRGDQKIKKEGS